MIEETQKKILSELTGLREEVRTSLDRISQLEHITTWSKGWTAGAMAVAGAVGAVACEIFRRFF